MNIFTLMGIFFQYLLQPLPFVLTFLLPAGVFLLRRRYVWFTIPLTVLIEVAVNWINFRYYESRGLMMAATLIQAAVMAAVILLLKAAARRPK